jgi:hypothetical protein
MRVLIRRINGVAKTDSNEIKTKIKIPLC